ncbi:uncharacterized protein LOC133903694 [Phragmites australis]|uniref:uncharacterized protein LOC133903694 n=1 Tax=Phragmites australis TaxID=29695 RepID=UPI002D776784|nr:uncharacterized protein LOC133903694 [Phragmites australis]
MVNTGSPSGRAGAGRRCGTLTHVDLLTFLLAATLCSASYCLAIWHNSRGAADSRVLGLSAVVPGAKSCGGDARADEPLDFVAHHTAEAAGLSVSAAAAATTTTSRRALRGVAWAGNEARGAAEAAGGDKLRFTDAGAVRA